MCLLNVYIWCLVVLWLVRLRLGLEGTVVCWVNVVWVSLVACFVVGFTCV